MLLPMFSIVRRGCGALDLQRACSVVTPRHRFSSEGLSDAPQLNSNQEGCLDIASAELRSAQRLHVTLRKWDSCNGVCRCCREFLH